MLTSEKSNSGQLVKLLLSFILFTITLMILYRSLDYLKPNYWNSYLLDKRGYYQGLFKVGFWAHVCTAPLLCFIAIFQVVILPLKLKKTHLVLGYTYVTLTLLLSAPGGIILSFYAFGGILSKLSFFILSVLWAYFTINALIHIKKRNIIQHKVYTIKSFILITSALTLRILMFVFSYYYGWNGVSMYTTASLSSWIVPLGIYEYYLLYYSKLKPQ